MGQFDWSKPSIEEQMNDALKNKSNLTTDEFNREYFGVFRCDPLTESEKIKLHEFRLDAKEYESRKRLNELD